jgi:nucleotide-binding universal stress UspA family protein
VTHRSLLVSPADAIDERAKTEGIELIVIGTRGLNPSQRLFLGSVSSGVVSGADMAVLVLK